MVNRDAGQDLWERPTAAEGSCARRINAVGRHMVILSSLIVFVDLRPPPPNTLPELNAAYFALSVFTVQWT
jgi:hypothetical protein